MVDWPTLSIFISVAAVLVFTPGPNTLYIIAGSVQRGRKIGAVSSLGVQAGTLIHVIIAALGLSALVVSSLFVFNLVKITGAAFLIFLGIKTLLTKDKTAPVRAVHQKRLSQIFRQGMIVNLFNPKTALFFFAFLPQFIDPARGAAAVQIAFLGCILVLLGTLSDMTYAMTAGSIGTWLRNNSRFLAAQTYFAGMVYIGLGCLTALSGTQNK